MIPIRHLIGIFALLGVTFAQVNPIVTPETSVISVWERGGTVALLLLAVVVLWRNGQQEGSYARKLLEQVLAAVQSLDKAGEQMKEATNKMNEICVRLEAARCPLIVAQQQEEDDEDERRRRRH